ncbi:hypothetical protein ACN9M1_27480 (plasmid) [Ralstonia sp. R-29]|uniref:hypothetical protein n=1 Tax=Ralstonia sp. R-29 TaxID=3404059 RepID=UPI003CF87316
MKLPLHSLVRIGTLAMLVAAGHASASDYGCKVLLCLANPASNGGPKGVAECVDPINRLYNDLAHGRPFPRCEEAEATGNRAVPVNDPFDPCPSPLQPAEPDQYVVQGQSSANSVFGYSQTAAPQLGATAGQRACVGRFVGRYQMGGNDDGTTINVYDRVVWQKAQSPRAIDLYQDNVWQQRVHW